MIGYIKSLTVGGLIGHILLISCWVGVLSANFIPVLRPFASPLLLIQVTALAYLLSKGHEIFKD